MQLRPGGREGCLGLCGIAQGRRWYKYPTRPLLGVVVAGHCRAVNELLVLLLCHGRAEVLGPEAFQAMLSYVGQADLLHAVKFEVLPKVTRRLAEDTSVTRFAVNVLVPLGRKVLPID